MNRTPNKKISIILVEDHTLTRFGLNTAFEEAANLEVIGEAETGEDGISMTLKLKPDIVLMDLGLPGMNGIEATRVIKENNEKPYSYYQLARIYLYQGDKQAAMELYRFLKKLDNALSVELLDEIHKVGLR